MARSLSSALPMILLLAWIVSPSAAQSDFSDAEYLACDVSDSLLAPDSLVARFDHDLQLIRQHTPAVADIHHACEKPRLGAVDLTLSYGAAVLFNAGQHEGLTALHAQLGSPQVTWRIGYSCTFYYGHPYNPTRLAALHDGLVGVSGVRPNTPCIGDGPDIRLLPEGTYLFRDAWGNCTAGNCDYSHTWVFRVDGEVVVLLEDYGDLVPVERTTWGSVKALFR